MFFKDNEIMTSHAKEAFHLVRGFQDFVEHNKADLQNFINSYQTQNITAVCLEYCFFN